jgi:hypothetical protein
MRFSNFRSIDGESANAAGITGSAIDTRQVVKMSAQVTSSGTGTGSLQLQVSNTPEGQTPVFSALGSPVAITVAGTQLVAQQDMCYRHLRALYTSTFLNVTTVTAVADVAGSLNNKYFLASSTTADYYFWFSNGTGVDPAIPNRTAIPVVYTDDDTATTLGGLIRTAAAAKGWTVTGATTQAILTNTAVGATALGTAGNSGFTVTNTQPTSSISVDIMTLGF